MKLCEWCEGGFTPGRAHAFQRFCSASCSQRARRARERLTRATKYCPWCNAVFPDTHALRQYCSRACSYKAARARRPARWIHLARRYGLTPAVFEEMFSAQGGCCAICATKLNGSGADGSAPNVDHDHETGLVRALLCRPCNIALGHLQDDPVSAQAAADYLTKWKAADARTA